MKVVQFLFILLSAFLIVILLLVFISDQPVGNTGQLHDTYKSMLHSGDSHIVHSSSNLLSYLFGLFVIGTMCTFVIIGAHKQEKLGKIKTVLFFGSILYILIYTLLFYLDSKYTASSHSDFFLGWPIPTACMMYAMWFTPMIFVFVYTLKYRDWILTEEEEQAFYKLLEKRKQRNTID